MARPPVLDAPQHQETWRIPGNTQAREDQNAYCVIRPCCKFLGQTVTVTDRLDLYERRHSVNHDALNEWLNILSISQILR